MYHSKLKKWHISGKRFFLRADLNVSIIDNVIQDDFRLRATLPTIDYILQHSGTIVLATHIGRPKFRNPQLSTHILLGWFRKHGYDIGFKTDLHKTPFNHKITLLENLRFFPGEQKKDPEFAKQLAHLGDYYVNDAFGVMHRNDTSVTLVPQLFPPEKRTFGLLVEKELRNLNKVRNNPRQPFVLIIGGKKVSDKISFIKTLLKKISDLVLCPAIVFTCLKNLKQSVGKSLVDDKSISLCSEITKRAKQHHVMIHYPIDYLIAENSFTGALQYRDATSFKPNDIGISIGPKTQTQFSQVIQKAQTIFFNGSIGFLERPETLVGMKSLLQAIARSNGYSVVAGGDTLAVVHHFGLQNSFDHISSGGGAALAYISGKPLPGLELVLNNNTARLAEMPNEL